MVKEPTTNQIPIVLLRFTNYGVHNHGKHQHIKNQATVGLMKINVIKRLIKIVNLRTLELQNRFLKEMKK